MLFYLAKYLLNKTIQSHNLIIMAKTTNTTNALETAVNIEKVWSKNPTMTLGKEGDPKNPKVTHADFIAVKSEIEGYGTQIETLRTQLEDLINQRNDSSKVLNEYNTRAFSAIRGIFGPDSSEYEMAGGTRSSERKTPVRKPKTPNS